MSKILRQIALLLTAPFLLILFYVFDKSIKIPFIIRLFVGIFGIITIPFLLLGWILMTIIELFLEEEY